jgi:hypothetical protein
MQRRIPAGGRTTEPLISLPYADWRTEGRSRSADNDRMKPTLVLI